MSDPVVEAAKRACGQFSDGTHLYPRSLGVIAAREALKPIRELHRKFDRGNEVVCHECRSGHGDFVGWPCESALLVYSSEELS